MSNWVLTIFIMIIEKTGLLKGVAITYKTGRASSDKQNLTAKWCTKI